MAMFLLMVEESECGEEWEVCNCFRQIKIRFVAVMLLTVTQQAHTYMQSVGGRG